MKSTEFIDYHLPPERIAAWPAVKRLGSRDAARLLCARQTVSGVRLVDERVSALPRILRPGDLLVLNSSRVMPYRFFGRLKDTGGEVEVLLLERGPIAGEAELRFLAVANPMRKLTPGRKIILTAELEGEAQERTPDGERIWITVRQIAGSREIAANSVEELLAEGGSMPIPPYIRKGRSVVDDNEFYQTVYAKQPGSIAAPTAGLHFTPQLISSLLESGVRISYIVLHVGAMSILPPREGVVGSERYEIPEETVDAVRDARDRGARVVAVGTTSARALESWAFDPTRVAGSTSLFIKPGYKFRCVDVMMTNFHQPGSTHLHMVNAFFGSDNVRAVYEHALCGEYLFLSYGDSMLLERDGYG